MENYYCPSLPNDSVTEILVRLPVKSLLRFRSVSKNWYSLIAIPYFEILLRLPVKSLLRFKSVCKNWYSLITSSCFIEKHHYHKENPTCHLITVYNQDPSHIIIYVLPEKILPDVALEKHIYLQIPVQFKIVGPLDGIFFLYKESHIMALWNPATKEFRPLPLPDFLPFIPSSLSYINNIFGFGFDPLSRDYKVVWISFCYDNDRSNPRVWFASVYSLGKDCWRNVTCNFDAKPSMVQSSCSTYVNGFYYWCASRHNEQVLLIPFFDMHNEVFGEIPSPGDLSRGDDFELTIYKESICLLVRHLDLDDDSNPPIDLWLMDDKRVWIKVVNVMPTRIELLNVVPDHISGCVPLGFWGHDKFIIFLSSEGRIILYDFKTQKFTHLLNTHDELYNCSALSYRESLVSIKGKNLCHRQGDILDFIQEYFKDYEEE